MLAVLAFADALTPELLLGLTFLLGCGTALLGPAWQAIQPELVERRQLGQSMPRPASASPPSGVKCVSVAPVGELGKSTVHVDVKALRPRGHE